MKVVVSEVRCKISCSQFLYAKRREETDFFLLCEIGQDTFIRDRQFAWSVWINQRFNRKNGSITKSVGWDIPDIGSPAHIEELQEEILIVGIPVTLTAKSFDFIVDALDLPR